MKGSYMTGNRQWWAREAGTGDARKDAARHLALTARRFAAERASAADVDEAISIWRAAAPDNTKDNE